MTVIVAKPSYLKGNYNNSPFLHDTTCSEIVNEINKMKSKFNSGIDEINSRIVPPYVTLPPPNIFNPTFTTGKIRNELKLA